MRLRNIPRAEGILTESPLVIKNETKYKGRWKKDIFHNGNPLYIEIGMGKGQFLLSSASSHPSINYIGIERYSSVLLRAVEKAVSRKKEDDVLPSNFRFLCMDAVNLEAVFAPQEVSRIYLNFSDPWPKARHARRRLTSPEYFSRYDHILEKNGQVEFKTDNEILFNFSVNTLMNSDVWKITSYTYDLHHDSAMNEGNIMTEYEEKFSSMNNPICKLTAKRQSDCPSCI